MPSDEPGPVASDPPPEFDWNPEKSARNAAERNLPFERARGFQFESAILRVDKRRDYGEVRVNGLGFIDDRLHVLTSTQRGRTIRVISFRKANRREARRYGKFFEIRRGEAASSA